VRPSHPLIAFLVSFLSSLLPFSFPLSCPSQFRPNTMWIDAINDKGFPFYPPLLYLSMQSMTKAFPFTPPSFICRCNQ
jgi:hypothetical protein